jgi:protein-S-isoprenylcysteine O-methyltransferase Ste14
MEHTIGAQAGAQPSLFGRGVQLAGNILLGTLFTLFAYAAFRSWSDSGHVQMLILAIQEAIIVGLVVVRRRSLHTSRQLSDWVIALVGTAAPMLQRPGDLLHPAIEPLGIGLQLLGAGLSVFATVSLGRSFGIVAANRGVRTTGLYRFVRHPLYGSYLVSYVGFLLGSASLINLVLIVFAAVCQYLRARAEERVLSLDPAYKEYMERVRWRFIPYIW